MNPSKKNTGVGGPVGGPNGQGSIDELVAETVKMFCDGVPIPEEYRQRLNKVLPEMTEAEAKKVALSFGSSVTKHFNTRTLCAGLILGDHFWNLVKMGERESAPRTRKVAVSVFQNEPFQGVRISMR